MAREPSQGKRKMLSSPSQWQLPQTANFPSGGGGLDALLEQLRQARLDARKEPADGSSGDERSLAEREEIAALWAIVAWLEASAVDASTMQPLGNLLRRLMEPQTMEAQRREIARGYLLLAMNELTSRGPGLGPDAMPVGEAAAWLAGRLPRELGQVFTGNKVTRSQLAAAILNLRRRAGRGTKSPGDIDLGEEVRRLSAGFAEMQIGSGRPWRSLPRQERAAGILTAMGQTLTA